MNHNPNDDNDVDYFNHPLLEQGERSDIVAKAVEKSKGKYRHKVVYLKERSDLAKCLVEKKLQKQQQQQAATVNYITYNNFNGNVFNEGALNSVGKAVILGTLEGNVDLSETSSQNKQENPVEKDVSSKEPTASSNDNKQPPLTEGEYTCIEECNDGSPRFLVRNKDGALFLCVKHGDTARLAHVSLPTAKKDEEFISIGPDGQFHVVKSLQDALQSASKFTTTTTSSGDATASLNASRPRAESLETQMPREVIPYSANPYEVGLVVVVAKEMEKRMEMLGADKNGTMAEKCGDVEYILEQRLHTTIKGCIKHIRDLFCHDGDVNNFKAAGTTEELYLHAAKEALEGLDQTIQLQEHNGGKTPQQQDRRHRHRHRRNHSGASPDGRQDSSPPRDLGHDVRYVRSSTLLRHRLIIIVALLGPITLIVLIMATRKEAQGGPNGGCI